MEKIEKKRLAIINYLKPFEYYTLLMLFIYTSLAISLHSYLENTFELILENLLIASGVIFLALINYKIKQLRSSEPIGIIGNIASSKKIAILVPIVQKLFLVPVILLIYSQVQNYLRVINPNLYDSTLASWDYAIFGANPTEWLMIISNPILTEIMQISYFSYYLIPLVIGFELHNRQIAIENGKYSLNKNYPAGDVNIFFNFAAILLFTYYISYLLYFLMPAIGPRFYIHNMDSIDTELSGLLLTQIMRDLINSGSTISAGLPPTPEYINRDCMPSGHTMITFLCIILAFKYASKYRWAILIVGTCLIISTVYLRYHYVVDVIAGIALVAIIFIIEPKLRVILEKK